MAYHEDFWVVMGTAGPVLGLAHVVTLERFARAWVSPTASKDDVPADLPHRWIVCWLISSGRSLPWLISLAGFTLSGILLGAASTSLLAEQDAWPGGTASELIAEGTIALLAFQALLAAGSNLLSDQVNRGKVILARLDSARYVTPPPPERQQPPESETQPPEGS